MRTMKQLFTLSRSASVPPPLLSCLLGAFVGCLLLLASCGGDDSSEVPPPPKDPDVVLEELSELEAGRK